MKLTPRAPEVKAIVEILQSDDYETPEAMAKAVIKEVAEILAMRETWYALVIKGGAKAVNFGPYASDAEVKQVAAKVAGAAPEFHIARMGGSGLLAARLEGYNKRKWTNFCATCTHAKDLHLTDGNSRARCALECSCQAYKDGG